MNHWPFIAAAYAIAIGGTIGVLTVSYAAMRRGEGGSAAAADGDRVRISAGSMRA